MPATTSDNDDATLSAKVSRVLGRDGDYARSWLDTGPLIEKYKIGLSCGEALWRARAFPDEDSGDCFWDAAPTPLRAVCHLILKLAEAGKLRG